MTAIQARLRTLPVPLSAIALSAALLLGAFGYTTGGWLLFGVGLIAWIRLDAKRLLESDRNGLPPALALLAYTALAGADASLVVTFGLALHALVVFLILLSRRLAEDIAHPFSHQKVISRSI